MQEEKEDEKPAGRWLSNINVVSWTSHTLRLPRRSNRCVPFSSSVFLVTLVRKMREPRRVRQDKY